MNIYERLLQDSGFLNFLVNMRLSALPLLLLRLVARLVARPSRTKTRQSRASDTSLLLRAENTRPVETLIRRSVRVALDAVEIRP
jgi:hypothetical protein